VVRPKAHGDVDRANRTDTFIERVNSFVDHWQEDSVDDKGWKILCGGCGLAKLFGESLNLKVGRCLGRNTTNQLDQLHHRDRIHEVHAHESARPVGDGSQSGYGNRRGIGADQRLRLQDRAKRLENFPLQLLVLARRLDHQVAIAKTLITGCSLNPG
jgi:hypothetical protein